MKGDSRGEYFDTSQYVGRPGQNPRVTYDRATGRFLQASGDFVTDRQTILREAKVGETRAMVRMWDYDGGEIAPTDPHAGWQRGQLVRGSQYVFVLTKLGPVYDPTDPATWRPNL